MTDSLGRRLKPPEPSFDCEFQVKTEIRNQLGLQAILTTDYRNLTDYTEEIEATGGAFSTSGENRWNILPACFIQSVEMNVKAAIAVILSLLFQWAAVAQCAVFSETEPSPAPACDCCAGLPSCPCASDDSDGPGKPPLPVLPDTLKLPVAKVVDSRVGIEAPTAPQVTRVAPTRPATGAMTGFAGVRLSVAFCSFVM